MTQAKRCPAAGEHVFHESLGLGKVVWSDGFEARIYFKGSSEPNPSERVRLFRDPWPFLGVVPASADEELDNLPPWKAGAFQGTASAVDLMDAKKKFTRLFPGGFEDPAFDMGERQYKISAKERFRAARPALEEYVAKGDSAALASELAAIYGDTKAPKEGRNTRLNLMYQKIDEPAFFDALRTGGVATTQFVQAALVFIDEPAESSFDSYVFALRALPTRKGGAEIDSRTTATWLPFIAAPERHLVIKPTIVQAFAGALPFDIQYRSELNHRTYSRCVAMARQLGARLQASELNRSPRTLDMIDVQSFMWVVERWRASDLRPQ